MDINSLGKLSLVNVGISSWTCEIILFLICEFPLDLSIKQAYPIETALLDLINFAHSRLDLPVVITSSNIKTLELISIDALKKHALDVS